MKMKNIDSKTFLVSGADGEVFNMMVSYEGTENVIYNSAYDSSVGCFFALIRMAIQERKAHISCFDSKIVPKKPLFWGYQGWLNSEGSLCWYPLGKLIGWISDNDLYLDMDAAWQETEVIAKELGAHQPSKRKLINMIKRGRLIVSSESGRNLTRIPPSGGRHVLHIHVSDLYRELKAEMIREKK